MQNVSVDTDTSKYAEVIVLPTVNTIAEGAELTETDPTFTPRTLQMFSYRAGTIISQEFAEDSIEHPKNILEPIAQAIAQNIDSDFINGAGTTEPMGLASMTGMYYRFWMGADGAVLAGYEPFEALWRHAREKNIDVSAFVMSPRTLGEVKLLETDTEGVQLPNIFPEIPMVESNMVLNTQEQGSSGAICSSIYCGGFKRNVVCGWRYGGPDSIKFLLDRTTLAEFGKIRLYGYTRMGIMYPRGYGVFGKIVGVLPLAAQLT